MKKKIQLSTVRQEADVEVIYVNAALICKVINAHNAITSIIGEAQACRAIKNLHEPVLDEDGNPVVDEKTGNEIIKPVVDEKGNEVFEYSPYYVQPTDIKDLNEVILPFLTELRNVLEGE